MSTLIERLGYYKVSNPLTGMMENANMLSEILCEEIDIEYSTRIIDIAVAEGFNPYQESLFGNVRSIARDARSAVSTGWRFIKDMIKKVIEMIKNILKEFFAAENQVGKLLRDCKKALNDRTRNIKDNNKTMKVITFNSLSELEIPIHQATRGSYSAKLLLMCGLLDKASSQRTIARATNGESYDSFAEVRKIKNNTNKPEPKLNNTNKPQQNNNTPNNNTNETTNTNSGKSEDGENIDTTGQNNGEVANTQDIINEMYNETKQKIADAMPNYSNETGNGKASQMSPDLKDYSNFIMAEIKGGQNMSNRDWADLLTEIAKVVNHNAKDYLSIAPGMITFVAREMYSYGLYSNKRISGDAKERKMQASDMNLQKLRKYRVKAPVAYEISYNMLRDFIELYTELQKQKLSQYFKNKEKALNTLSSKLDRLQNRINDNTRDGKQELNNQRGATPLVDQGRNTNNNKNMNIQSNNNAGNNPNAQSADYMELLNDIKNYSPYGEGIFGGSRVETPGNRGTGNTKPGQQQSVPQDEETTNLIQYVRAYIVGTSQGLMQAASFYNAILKKWNEACRSTLIAFYATSSNNKEASKLEDYDNNAAYSKPEKHEQDNQEIPGGQLNNTK